MAAFSDHPLKTLEIVVHEYLRSAVSEILTPARLAPKTFSTANFDHVYIHKYIEFLLCVWQIVYRYKQFLVYLIKWPVNLQ